MSIWNQQNGPTIDGGDVHIPSTRVPSFSNEEIVNPDIPSEGVQDSGHLLWGGFPTLIERIRYWQLERQKRKAMDPVQRAQLKAWKKYDKDMRKKNG